MDRPINTGHGEGLKSARLLMVLSSFSPLFILWALRGSSLIPDCYLILLCGCMGFFPTVFLCHRIRTAKKEQDKWELSLGKVDGSHTHILVYLFAILLPFYRQDVETWRDLIAMCVALALIVFIFWRLNLHYINLVFALRGYHVFTIYPPADTNPYSGKTSYMLITQRVSVSEGTRIIAHRVSDTLYIEEKIGCRD